MKIRIEKGKAEGRITAPPSKSMAHRLLIAAALAEGKSTVRGISMCEDVLATVDCLRALGARIELCGEDATVYGMNARNSSPKEKLFCRESGSTLRFLIPIAMLSDAECVFCGSEGLMRRPTELYEKLFAEKGLKYIKKSSQIEVCGRLMGGEYTVPGNISSQFISGLLFALPLADGDSVIRINSEIESRSYIDLTLYALNTFGIEAGWADKYSLKIKGNQSYSAKDVEVEGDASGAAFIEALNFLGGNAQINGLNPESIQGDSVYPQLFEALKGNSPVISLGDCPDLAPVLFALAAKKNGGTFLETKRLKIKESDRAEVMAEELRKFGVCVTVNENSVEIDSKGFHAPAECLSGHNDHRIVMALSVLLTAVGGEIDGAEAVSKSYPEFFEHLRQLKIEAKEI
ncbi:MAG: 3-phosphoshikimate 1-carboxyvinyltransferase [Ruminococcaceae bacterium]|nr:3-phosphoshikimate 1-carboxyvinyltransferase [Oscillospiraceae bacterium]